MFRYLPFFEQSQLPMRCFTLSGCTSLLGMDYQAISGKLVRGFVRPAARTSRASNRAARAGAVPRPPASASAWRASCPRLACTGPAQPAIQPPLSAASCKHPALQTAIASNINYQSREYSLLPSQHSFLPGNVGRRAHRIPASSEANSNRQREGTKPPETCSCCTCASFSIIPLREETSRCRKFDRASLSPTRS